MNRPKRASLHHARRSAIFSGGSTRSSAWPALASPASIGAVAGAWAAQRAPVKTRNAKHTPKRAGRLMVRNRNRKLAARNTGQGTATATEYADATGAKREWAA